MKRLFFIVLLLVLVCGSEAPSFPAQAQGLIEFTPLWGVCLNQAYANGNIIAFYDASYLFTCEDAPTPDTVDAKTMPHTWQVENTAIGCIIEKINKSKFSMACTYSPPGVP
jgi:hypothetical protein